MMFNLNPAHPTSDKAVREAIATALDPKALGQATYNGNAIPTSSFMAPDAQCYDPGTKALMPTPSTTKAKQIMTAAGYQVGGDGTSQDKTRRQPLTIVIAGSNSQNNGLTMWRMR